VKSELRQSLARLAAGVLAWILCALCASALPQKSRRANAPSVGSQRSVPAQKRVLLIGIDGCRPDALLAADTPHLNRLIAKGASTGDARAVAPTLSGPNWSSLLTGVSTAKHGVVDNTFAGNDFSTYPHFFARIKERRPSTFTASFAQWNLIHRQIVSGADVSMGGLTDTEVVLQATSLILTADPQVIFLHLNDVDLAGHTFGFSPTTPEYLAAIEATDLRVGAVVSALSQRTAAGIHSYENWLIAVTTDHGGVGHVHGGNSNEETQTWLILSGPSIANETRIPPGVDIFDVPVTLLDHLGLQPAPAWNLDGVSILPAVRIP